MPKKNFYAVKNGKRPGIYTSWYGKGGAHEQVDGFAGAVYKGFQYRPDAEQFMNNGLLRSKPLGKRKTNKTPYRGKKMAIKPPIVKHLYTGSRPPWDFPGGMIMCVPDMLRVHAKKLIDESTSLMAEAAEMEELND